MYPWERWSKDKSVFALLTLPNTSKGLTALEPAWSMRSTSSSPHLSVAKLLVWPPTLIPPLLPDHDPQRFISQACPLGYVFSTAMVRTELGCSDSTLTGFSGIRDKNSDSTERFGLVRRCIKISLTRAGFDMLPATYERIFSNCRALVIDYGEDLHGALKLELEQSLIMIEESKEEIYWLADFVEHCEWFESQIVSCLYTYEGIGLGTH